MEQRTKLDPLGLVETYLDRYYIEEMVGSGGMGVVYRARHEFGGYDVAVKVLHSNLAADAKMVDYFFDEAKKTASLKHPAIVRVTDVGQEGGRAFLVMEWLDGRTLEAELQAAVRLPVERVAGLLDPICEAVAYAHGRGVIHRDLKPGNIMLVAQEGGDETVRILDFGVAKVLDATFGANTKIAGTPYYASPEQLRVGAQIDPRSDIYSLGVTLFQLLTGERPFDADSAQEVIQLHNEEPPPLRQICPSIPPAIEDVVLKALAKQPGDRYQTVTDLARAFRQAASLATGALVVECVDALDERPVAGAVVYLNGTHAGLSDEGGQWRQDDLMPRSYLIEVEAPRYQRYHRPVGIEQPREEVTLSAKLERETKGDLIVVCNVEGAEVELDGVRSGVTGAGGRCYLNALDAGQHTIVITHPKHLPEQSSVEIKTWESSQLQLQLTPRVRFKVFRELAENIRALIRRPRSKAEPASAQVECGACGTKLDVELNYCVECGAPLRQPAAPVSDVGWADPSPDSPSSDDSLAKPGNAQSYPFTPPQLPRSGRRLWWMGGAVAALIGLAVWWSLRVPSRPPPEPVVTLPTPEPTPVPPPAPPEGMVLLPGGEFEMGRNGGNQAEAPAHRVSVKPFFLDRTEVTNAQYQKFIDETNRRPPQAWRDKRYPRGQENLPVTDVTWEDAKEYAQWTGKRLPTEEEWEFAARGEQGRLYPWGDEWSSEKANAGGRSVKLSPVGQYPQGARPSGILDLIGNAWEWTSSDCAPYPGSGGSPCFPGYRNLKIKRGGAFDSPRNVATATHRSGQPATRDDWPRNGYIDYTRMGFRCAMDAPAQ